MEPKGAKIGFVGLGVMGGPMAGHLMSAGASLHVFTRTSEKATALVEAGAVWHATPAELARECDVVFTMVGYPKDVEEVYFGSGGLIANGHKGLLLIDTTTSRPDLARRIHDAARKAGLRALDAPVSGGDLGARNATLTIMVGGESSDFTEAEPLLRVLGKTVILQGPAGAGQHTKMANQIVIAGNLTGAIEAMVYAQAAGLDPRRVLESISSGSAASWQLTSMMPRVLDGNFAPGFYAKHFLKDLRIALDSAKAMKANLPLLELAERLFSLVETEGKGEFGTQVLYQLYKEGRI